MGIDISLSHLILFLIFVVMMIFSIVCSLIILYHFARSQDLRKKINNHVILSLLVVNLFQVIIDLPLTLVELRTDFVFIQTPSFCTFWIVFNYSICVMGLMIMAYGCIERYLLIFYGVFFKSHLFLLHYVPLLFCLIYPPLLYIGLVVIYPCTSFFDYTSFTCGGSCYQYEFSLGLFDWFSNICVPVIIGVIATIILIVRVLIQKRRMGQNAIWRRNRKMVFQLTTVSTMYVIVWVPIAVLFVIPIISPDSDAFAVALSLFIYFEYFVCLLCPFMCLLGLPTIRRSIREKFTRFNIVRPTTRNP